MSRVSKAGRTFEQNTGIDPGTTGNARTLQQQQRAALVNRIVEEGWSNNWNKQFGRLTFWARRDWDDSSASQFGVSRSARQGDQIRINGFVRADGNTLRNIQRARQGITAGYFSTTPVARAGSSKTPRMPLPRNKITNTYYDIANERTVEVRGTPEQIVAVEKNRALQPARPSDPRIPRDRERIDINTQGIANPYVSTSGGVRRPTARIIVSKPPPTRADPDPEPVVIDTRPPPSRPPTGDDEPPPVVTRPPPTPRPLPPHRDGPRDPPPTRPYDETEAIDSEPPLPEDDGGQPPTASPGTAEALNLPFRDDSFSDSGTIVLKGGQLGPESSEFNFALRADADFVSAMLEMQVSQSYTGGATVRVTINGQVAMDFKWEGDGLAAGDTSLKEMSRNVIRFLRKGDNRVVTTYARTATNIIVDAFEVSAMFAFNLPVEFRFPDPDPTDPDPNPIPPGPTPPDGTDPDPQPLPGPDPEDPTGAGLSNTTKAGIVAALAGAGVLGYLGLRYRQLTRFKNRFGF